MEYIPDISTVDVTLFYNTEQEGSSMKLVIYRMKIEASRLEHGYSMKQLAKEAELSEAAVRSAIYGEAMPMAGTLKKIANALGLKVSDFVTVETGYDETRKRPGRKRKAVVNE